MDGEPTPDKSCREIERLTTSVLSRLGSREGGWVTLYRDPTSGTLWERDYPQAQVHGGGPPRLREVSSEEALALYGSDVVTGRR